LTISVSAPSLDDFDLDAIEVAGGNIAAVRDDGFDLTITEPEAIVSLPVFDDGVSEGGEIATFTLEPDDTYQINQAAAEATFALGDTLIDLEQVGVPEEIEDNNTIAQANVLGLSIENPNAVINGSLFGYGSDFPEIAFGYAEDVDFYSVVLEAGQTISLDIDSEKAVARI
jgi:hypothetical protein